MGHLWRCLQKEIKLFAVKIWAKVDRDTRDIARWSRRLDMTSCSTGLRAETTIGIVLITAFNARAQPCEVVTITSGESRRMSSITSDHSSPGGPSPPHLPANSRRGLLRPRSHDVGVHSGRRTSAVRPGQRSLGRTKRAQSARAAGHDSLAAPRPRCEARGEQSADYEIAPPHPITSSRPDSQRTTK